MYRYVYKITITEGYLKDFYYYGKHTTKNFNDNYHGSSSILNKLNYFEKYPNGWKREIIKMCINSDEQTELENKLIREHKHEEKCLNAIRTCSSGGNITNWTDEKRKEIREKKQKTWKSKTEEEMLIHAEKSRQNMLGEKNPMWQTNYSDFMTEEAAKERDRKWYNTMMNKSPEEKAEINKKRGKGGKKMKGSIVISNELCIKRIMPKDLEYYLGLGYERGMKKYTHRNK